METMEKSKKNRYFIIGILCFTGMLFALAFLLLYAQNNIESSIAVSLPCYYLLAFLMILTMFFSVKNRSVFFVYVVSLFFFYAWLSLADVHYSPIDEAMHFDFINHITAENRLETFSDVIDNEYLGEAIDNAENYFVAEHNFEAVQAPLYYIGMTIISKFISNAYLRLHILRLISLLSVLLVYYYVQKALFYLNENNILSLDGEIFRLGMLLTVFNHGYLYRASRLNNEMLVCVLSAVLLYVTVKCVVDGYSRRSYWTMSLLCVALFLTKNTAVYVYIVIVLVALLQRRILQAILPVLASSLLTIPWFFFNYSTYGSLTAMDEHVKMVLPIVNPGAVSQDIFDGLFNIVPLSYFSGEEIPINLIEKTWIDAVYIILIAFVISIVIEIIRTVECKGMSLAEYGKRCHINIICTIWLMACGLCLTLGTVSTKMMSLRGRYFYGPCIILVVLLVLNEEAFSENIWKYISWILIITLGVVTVRTTVTFLDKVYSDKHLFACNVTNLELADLTDDNWLHGYSKTDNKLLLKIGDNDVIEDYNVLVDRIVTNGMQSALITGVSDAGTIDGGGRFVELSTSAHVNPDKSEDSHLRIAEYCHSESYNISKKYCIMERIDGQEIAQTLRIKEDSVIWGFETMLGTYAAENYAAVVKYVVRDAAGKVLADSQARLEQIKDNAYTTVCFAEPVEVRKGEEIRISLTYQNSNDQPLALYVSKKNHYKEGALYLNGIKMKGKDMGIRLLVN